MEEIIKKAAEVYQNRKAKLEEIREAQEREKQRREELREELLGAKAKKIVTLVLELFDLYEPNNNNMVTRVLIGCSSSKKLYCKISFNKHGSMDYAIKELEDEKYAPIKEAFKEINETQTEENIKVWQKCIDIFRQLEHFEIVELEEEKYKPEFVYAIISIV